MDQDDGSGSQLGLCADRWAKEDRLQGDDLQPSAGSAHAAVGFDSTVKTIQELKFYTVKFHHDFRVGIFGGLHRQLAPRLQRQRTFPKF